MGGLEVLSKCSWPLSIYFYTHACSLGQGVEGLLFFEAGARYPLDTLLNKNDSIFDPSCFHFEKV